MKPTMSEPAKVSHAELENTLLAVAAELGAAKTFCPSDVARKVGGTHPDHWGPLMVPLRRIAVRLAHEGRLVIYRKGKPVDPDNFKGIYRLGLPKEQ